MKLPRCSMECYFQVIIPFLIVWLGPILSSVSSDRPKEKECYFKSDIMSVSYFSCIEKWVNVDIYTSFKGRFQFQKFSFLWEIQGLYQTFSWGKKRRLTLCKHILHQIPLQFAEGLRVQKTHWAQIEFDTINGSQWIWKIIHFPFPVEVKIDLLMLALDCRQPGLASVTTGR